MNAQLNVLASLRRADNMPIDGAIQRRGIRASVPLPLLGRLTLCGPGVDGGNLLLEGGVDETMALEGVEALELRGDDEGCECRATTA